MNETAKLMGASTNRAVQQGLPAWSEGSLKFVPVGWVQQPRGQQPTGWQGERLSPEVSRMVGRDEAALVERGT